jgi:hypothetical protein
MTASRFFRLIATGEGGVGSRLIALLDFENRGWFFPDVHRSFKFCAYVAGGEKRRTGAAECAFFLHRVVDLNEPDRVFKLTAEDFAVVNPNTGTAPIFRSARDAVVTTAVYRRLPVLVDRRDEAPQKVWPVDYVRMFDMTNDSHLFRTRAQLDAEGAYAVQGGHLKRGETTYLPLYVGRMIHQFDHRAASVKVNEALLHNPALSDDVTPEEKRDPSFSPRPQFYVAADEIDWPNGVDWLLGFRDIARVTDARTVIAALVPKGAVGNTLPLIRPDLPRPPATEASEDAIAEWHDRCAEVVDSYRRWAPLLLGNLNSFALDFIARQKVQSTHLNWYIVEQLPVVPQQQLRNRVGRRPVEDMIRAEVLRLTYVAHDMAAFARDQGYEGAPFPWDKEDRLRRRARLDALFFLLYGLDTDAVSYVLDQFPIIRRHEEEALGRYRSKDLIHGYLAAFRANDPDAVIAA